MRPQRFVLQSSFTVLAILAGGASTVPAQDGSRPIKPAEDSKNLPRPEVVVWNAIRSHPVTAPYPITTSLRNGTVVLSGRVGTKQVHDVAVRLAIECGVSFRDDLVIDSGVAGLVAQTAAMAAPGAAAVSSSSPYVYPPPLMGRVDDPFFGFVPPLVSFPPWWRRPVQNASFVQPGTVPTQRCAGSRGPWIRRRIARSFTRPGAALRCASGQGTGRADGRCLGPGLFARRGDQS